jgi:predicted secreted protein
MLTRTSKALLSTVLVVACSACNATTPEPAKSEANVAPASSGATPLTSSSAPSAAAAGAPRIYPQTTTTIDARAGDKFTVALPGNVSTPYEWRFDESPDKAVVSMKDKAYVDAPPANCQGCDGYKGTYTFTFTANAAGNAKLHFSYASVVPPGSPAEKQVSIDVRVTK